MGYIPLLGFSVGRVSKGNGDELEIYLMMIFAYDGS
jgi:hypothetical protein